MMSKDKADSSIVTSDASGEIPNHARKKDPYYVASSNGQHLIITQVQLSDKNPSHNYDEWAKAIHMSLRSKRKLKFLDGLIPILKDDPEKEEEWWAVKSLIGSWILNTIGQTLRNSINYFERVEELWAGIKERFLVGDGS